MEYRSLITLKLNLTGMQLGDLGQLKGSPLLTVTIKFCMQWPSYKIVSHKVIAAHMRALLEITKPANNL